MATKDAIGRSDIYGRSQLTVRRRRSHELRGRAGSPGIHRGAARVIRSKEDYLRVLPGDIVVSQTASPELVSLLDVAGGLVTDVGGVLCHLVTVARELRIPVVVATRTATEHLVDGDVIVVNGNNGVVTRVRNQISAACDRPATATGFVEPFADEPGEPP